MLSITQNKTAVTVVATPQIAARRVAEEIVRIINTNDTLGQPTKIGFATGATMVPVYQELVSNYQIGRVSFKNVIGVNLDEYTVPSDNAESYCRYMADNLYDHVNISHNNIHIPDGGAQNIQSSCDRYNKLLDQLGPMDVQLLGIGRNAHIGFNEPPANASSRTHVVQLAPSTHLINTAPSTHAITMGISDILKAQYIILLATGDCKAETINNFIKSAPDNCDIPASFIKSHPNINVICDWDAASKIESIRAEASKIVSRDSLNVTRKLENKKNLLIWSPHPDDDVIGLGGFIHKYHKSHNISIVYQTTGRNAVSPDIVAYQRQFLNTIFKKHSITDKTIGVAVRRVEAKTAAQLCGVEDVTFIEMPFYKRKHKKRQPVAIEDDDITSIRDILNEKRPDVIFVNGDTDPNHTHNYCKTAILMALDGYEKQPSVYEYCSAWGEFSLTRASLLVALTAHQMKIKKRAILAHESQNPPLVHNGNPTPFHERALNNARDALALLKKMGFTYHCDITGIEILSSNK